MNETSKPRNESDSMVSGVGAASKCDNSKPPFFSKVLQRKSYFVGWSGLEHVDVRLFNLGNTCFVNSVVQVLFHTPSFVSWLAGDTVHRNTCQNKSCVTCALGELRLEMLKYKDNTYPLVFLSTFKGYIMTFILHFIQEIKQAFGQALCLVLHAQLPPLIKHLVVME